MNEKLKLSLIENTDNDLSNYPNCNEETTLALETFNKLNNSLKIALTDRGITSNEASCLDIAVEHLNKQLGINPTRLFSLEDYNGYYNNINSCKIAIENIAVRIIEVIKKIAAWIRDAIKYVIELIISRLDEYKGISSKVKQLKLRASEIGNKSPKKPTVNDTNLATFLSYDSKVLDAKDIIKNYNLHVQNTSVHNAKKYMKNVISNVTKVTDTIIKENIDLDTTLKATDAMFKELLYGALKHVHIEKKSPDTEGFDLYSYDYLFGQKKLEINLGKQKDLYKSISTKISSVNTQYTFKELKTLETSEINSICTMIDHEMLFGNATNYKEVIRDLESIKSTVDKNINKLLDGDVTNGEAQFSVHFLRDIVSATINYVQITSKYDIMVNKKILRYCELSLDQY